MFYLAFFLKGKASGNKSPRGGILEDDNPFPSIPLYDEEGGDFANTSNAAIIGPKSKIEELEGMRFNVKLKRGKEFGYDSSCLFYPPTSRT